jgi:hypothetical protein
MGLSRFCFAWVAVSSVSFAFACGGDADEGTPASGTDDVAGAAGAGGTSADGGSAGAGTAGDGGGADTAGAAGVGGGAGAASSGAGAGGTMSDPSAGAGGDSSAGAAGSLGGAAGTGGGGGAGMAGMAGMAGTAGMAACVGHIDDSEPNDTLATAYDLGSLEPDFPDECGGTVPQVSFDGAIGPGDVDFAKVLGNEAAGVRCAHTPKIITFEPVSAFVCLAAKCATGTATFTCPGAMGVDLGNGYIGCCADLTQKDGLEVSGFTCSGATNVAKLLVRVTALPNASTCEPYGLLVSF